MNNLKKRITIVTASISIFIIGILIFFYSLGLGFGKAVINSANGIRNAKQEWNKNGVNPIDSIQKEVKEFIEIDK